MPTPSGLSPCVAINANTEQPSQIRPNASHSIGSRRVEIVPVPGEAGPTWAQTWRMEISMDPNNELLTTAEVAVITRAPVSTVRYWRHLGTGPRSFRLGRRVVYRRQEVEQWLREHEMSDASATAS